MRTRRQTARVTALGLSALCIVLVLSGSRAHAQSSRERSTFEIPPAPSAAAPRLAIEVHSGFSIPLHNASLCPDGVGCVLRSGGGIGATVERRWPRGFGAFGGYDVWFLDSDSVYELGVQQALRGGVRYTMPNDIVYHPICELGVGVMGYGDTFRVATVGGLVQVFAGAEIELSATFGLRIGFGLRAFTHTKFRTERDDVLRARHGLATEAVFLELGLTVM